MTAVRHTDEMGDMQEHWHEITQGAQHQTVVKHQGKLIVAAVKVLHGDDEAEAWMDPAHSPVMFDAWHVVYLYVVAMGKGDLEPMLDFMIDGKYADEYVHHVNPKFDSPKNYPEDLYLF